MCILRTTVLKAMVMRVSLIVPGGANHSDQGLKERTLKIYRTFTDVNSTFTEEPVIFFIGS